MGEMDMVSFEAAVEKLCADWEVDVAKFLKRGQTDINTRNHALGKSIAALPIPQKTDIKEVLKLPDRINEILGKENARLKNLVSLRIPAKIDPKTRKLTITGYGMTGKYATFQL